MSKTLLNKSAGLFSLLIFLILSMLNIRDGIEKHIRFLILGFVLMIASVFVISKAFPRGNGAYWLSILPFSLLAVAAKIVFGWDILLPFILCGYGAMTISGFAMNPPEKKGEPLYSHILPLAVVLAAAAIYIGLCAVVGVYL